MAASVEVREIPQPDYIQDVKGRRPKAKGKIKIPHYNELPMVKGIFKNIEMPGTGISFPFRAWKGPVKTFTLFDGGEYVIPRVLADHLNDNCHYKVMQWRSGAEVSTAQPIMIGGGGFRPVMEDATKEVKSRTHRFLFQILSDA
jgi:hypothetical protein